ncbi:MAG: DUF1501 domain-containing protein [Gemmataceae bacterium]|nr:DUF1501 domain-containing protein [Planctomycetota bacterium]
MSNPILCGSEEQKWSRRKFLTTSAGIAGVPLLAQESLSRELKKQGKSVILLWLAGGSSQLETWDPKPGVITGGPFQAIQTSTPGVYISELMPKMAKRFKDTCIIRSLNTKNGDHGGGAQLMMRGRRDEASLKYPDMGAVLAKELGNPQSQVPDYVSFFLQTEGRDFSGSGFLGARYSPMELSKSVQPENIDRPDHISTSDFIDRMALRDLWSTQFEKGRSSGVLASHQQAYGRVKGLMDSKKLFDVSLEPQKVRDRFGPTQFAEQVLIARRLAEAGVPFIRVARAWWDSHGQNFETHQEMVPELDHVMAALLDDLEERGMLKNTLVITLAEFGRTPSINSSLGRDHFASAWSTTLSGCGIVGGSVYGKTDAKGEKVADGEIGAARLLATIYRALGINHQKNYYVGSRPVPLTDPETQPVKEVLA